MAETVYGEAEARRPPVATLHTALPLPFRSRALLPPVHETVLASLPVIVNDTAPLALTTGAEVVLNGDTAAVKVTA